MLTFGGILSEFGLEGCECGGGKRGVGCCRSWGFDLYHMPIWGFVLVI